MADTRALVLGAGGFLGRRIIGGRAGLIPVDVGHVSARTDLARVRSAVARAVDAHPGLPLLNCIGVRRGNATELKLLNGDLPEAVVSVAKVSNTAVIHLGSAAEVLLPLRDSDGIEVDIPALAHAYAESKRIGSRAVASYEHGTVLRVYNMRGLPHQEHSGLHQMCKAVRAALQGGMTPPLVDTERDYVHWTEVVAAVEVAVSNPAPGLVEVCSGVGITMSEIAARLPRALCMYVSKVLLPADLFAPVVGPVRGANPKVLADALAREVLACASS